MGMYPLHILEGIPAKIRLKILHLCNFGLLIAFYQVFALKLQDFFLNPANFLLHFALGYGIMFTLVLSLYRRKAP